MEAAHARQQRRQFLRGDWSGKRLAVRPPWAVAEAQFTERCSRCDACRTACPERLIVSASGGFPAVDFSRGGCDLCGACARACTSKALVADAPGTPRPWRHRVVVLDNCLALHGVVCRTCGDFCDADAIRFQRQLGGCAQPLVSAAACTGCGSCLAPCPVQALALRFPPEEDGR